MKAKKAIKRNPSMVEFSKDHHFALLLIWKIREGLRNAVEPVRISKYVLHFFNKNLVDHFREEEELLFAKLPVDNVQRRRAESEHGTIRQLVEDITGKPGDKNLLESFAGTLEQHIRFEERELFNYLQETLSEKELAEIASQVKTPSHEPDSAWEDNFWKHKSNR